MVIKYFILASKIKKIDDTDSGNYCKSTDFTFTTGAGKGAHWDKFPPVTMINNTLVYQIQNFGQRLQSKTNEFHLYSERFLQQKP